MRMGNVFRKTNDATTINTEASHSIRMLVPVLELKLKNKQLQHPNNG